MPINKDMLSFTVQDLSLLMEAYKNNVELSTALSDQVKHIIDNQKDLANSMLLLNQNTIKLNESIVKMTDKISDLNTTLIKEQSDFKNDITKNHSELKNLIWGSYVGMVTIIITILMKGV